MQAFLLACYICLQFTNLSDLNPISQSKRDSSCDRCLAGILEPNQKTQEGYLTNNPILREALEERLMLELSRNPSKAEYPKKEEAQPQKTLGEQQANTQTKYEEMLKSTESTLKNLHERATQTMQKKAQEISLQLQQLNNEFGNFAAQEHQNLLKGISLTAESLMIKTKEEEKIRLEQEARLAPERYNQIVKGINVKMGSKVNAKVQGPGVMFAEINDSSNEKVWTDFLNELTMELKANHLNHLLTDLRMRSLPGLAITNQGLKNMATKLSSFKYLKRLDFIHIAGGDSLTIEGITSFISSVALELPDIEGFRIGLVGCQTIKELSSIAYTILTKFKNLRELVLEFEGSAMTNQEMKRLASVLSENGRALTTLNIKIAASEYVEAEGFIAFNSEFFKGLPNLTFLTLDYWFTKITDQAIFSLSERISEYCRGLQTLIINTPQCNGITIQAPKYLANQINLNRLPSLKRLEFNADGKLRDAAYDVQRKLGKDITTQIN